MADETANEEVTNKTTQYTALAFSLCMTATLLLCTEWFFDCSVMLCTVLLICLVLSYIALLAFIYAPVGEKASKYGSIISAVAIATILLLLFYNRNKVSYYVISDAISPDVIGKKIKDGISPSGVVILIGLSPVQLPDTYAKLDIGGEGTDVSKKYAVKYSGRMLTVLKKTSSDYKDKTATPELLEEIGSDSNLVSVLKKTRFSGITNQAIWNVVGVAVDADTIKKAGFKELKQ